MIAMIRSSSSQVYKRPRYLVEIELFEQQYHHSSTHHSFLLLQNTTVQTVLVTILTNLIMTSTTSTPVWFITGAGTGFGHAIALEALKRNHHVVATARRTSSLDDLVSAGAKALALDVNASESEIAAVVKEAHDIYGRLDYLVNAAGYVLEGAVEESS